MSRLYEHLRVCYLAQGYLGGALKVKCLCLKPKKPSVSEPSPLETKLPLAFNVRFIFISMSPNKKHPKALSLAAEVCVGT